MFKNRIILTYRKNKHLLDGKMTLPQASVQYDDFKGTIAVDETQDRGIGKYLQSKDLIGDKTRVTAVEAYVGERIPGSATTVHVTATVVGLTDDIAPNGDFQTVKTDMELEDFFDLFQRTRLVIERKLM